MPQSVRVDQPRAEGWDEGWDGGYEGDKGTREVGAAGNLPSPLIPN